MFSPPLVDDALLLQWRAVGRQQGGGSGAGRSIDGLDGAEEHLRVPSDGVQLHLTCLLFPPLVLHASERCLGLALEVLEVVEGRSFCQAMKAFCFSLLKTS